MDVRDLRVLEAVQQDSRLTQRGLASKLGIALGLANIYLKRMIHKGYIKCVNVQPNRISYLITPRGIAEKARLTYEFMDYSLHLYGEVRQHLRAALRECAAAGKRVAICGSGGRRSSRTVAEGIGSRSGRGVRYRWRPRLPRYAGAAELRPRHRRFRSDHRRHARSLRPAAAGALGRRRAERELFPRARKRTAAQSKESSAARTRNGSSLRGHVRHGSDQ